MKSAVMNRFLRATVAGICLVFAGSVPANETAEYMTFRVIRDGVSAEPDTVTFRDASEADGWTEHLLRRYAEQGRPFARVDFTAAREPEPGQIVVETHVRPGPEVVVQDVRAFGNSVTRDAVIAREYRRPAGAVYHQKDAERWQRRLRRTGYFEYVGDPALVWRDSTNGAADLIIDVREGLPNRFEGVVGYQPSTAGEKGQFTGLVDVLLGNLWGTGRRLAVRWQRPEPGTTTLDVSYTEPWVAGYPLNAAAIVAIEQRIGYALEDLELTLSGEVFPDLVLCAGFGREKARSDSIAALAGPRYEGWLLTGSGSYDTRDNTMNPSSGVLYSASWRVSLRTNRVNDADFVAWYGESGWPEEERMSTAQVDLEHFLRVRGSLVFALGLHGAEVSGGSSGTVSEADMLRLGGALNLRGYAQEQFSGDRILWCNSELRYHLGTASRAFAFVDAGSVRSVASDDGAGSTTRTHVGYGVGLRARTRAGLLGIDFAWGKDDGFGEGKVHVRIETEF